MSLALSALACSVCFGDPAAQINKGILPALALMLVCVGTLLSAIAWTGYRWVRRAKRLGL